MRIGAAEDAAKSADSAIAKTKMDLAKLAGLDTIRLTSTWSTGETAPAPAELTRLRNAAAAADLDDIDVIVAVFPFGSSVTPTSATERSNFVSYAVSVARELTTVKEFIVGNEPNNNRFWMPQFDAAGNDAAAPAYETLLAETYDALHAARADITVYGGALAARGADCSTCTKQAPSPTVFLRDLGAAYRASPRTAPIMDAFAFHPYPDANNVPPSFQHPSSTTISIADYGKLVAELGNAFDGTGQRGSTLPILYTEFGVETTVPPEKASKYTGSEIVSTVDAATQAAAYREALKLAWCQPTVTGLLFFLVSDEARLDGWQSGLRYADDTAKPSLDAVSTAAPPSCPDAVSPAVTLHAPASASGTVTLTADATDDVGVARVDFVVDGVVLKSDGVPPYDATWTTTTDGDHVVAARAFDAVGNGGASTTSVSVANAPDTILDSASAGTFAFHGTGGTVSFECAVDGAVFAPSASWTIAAPPSGGGGGGQPDLAVRLEPRTTQLRVGDAVDVTAWASNLNGAGAGGVKLTIVLPEHTALLGPPSFEHGPGCSGTTTIECNLDFLSEGQTPVRFALRVDSSGSHVLTASVLSNEADPRPADNTTTVDLVATADTFLPPRQPAVDTTAPQTTIARVPATTRSRSLTVSFAASERGARFECKLDRARFRACVSPLRLRKLALGPHTLWVRATPPGTAKPPPRGSPGA